MAKLLYSRYHLTTGQTSFDKIEFFQIGLSNDASIYDRGFIYKFFNSEIVELFDRKFISGELVKYNPDDSSEVVDDITKTIVNENIHNKVVARARYILDPFSSVLMHVDVPQHIGISNFHKKFQLLFEKNHENLFIEISLSPIKEQYSFSEELKTFKSVKRISIALVPSNPNFSENWRSIDERMRNNGIDRYKETQEAKKEGSSLIVDEETANKFLMAEDGYGDCDAFGITTSGEEKKISTKDNQKNMYSNLPPELNKAIEILAVVSETLNKIIGRTIK